MTYTQRRAAITDLTGQVDSQLFYRHVAKYDPANKARWLQMVTTQEVFKKGEADYNAKTKDYSQRMRRTLHLGIIEVFKDGNKLDELQGHSWNPDTLFTWFIKAHMTAFRENGWLDEGVSGSDVAKNTRIRDYLNGNIILMTQIKNIALSYVFPDPYMVRAAASAKASL